MRREEARADINNRPLTDFIPLERSPKAGKGMYCCPICKSGTGPKGTGAFKVYYNESEGKYRNICNAGGCLGDKGEDNVGTLRRIWACSEDEVFTRCGYDIDYERSAMPTKQPKEDKDYTSFFRRCHEALKDSPEALDYLHSRGISDASIERFNLGYCATWKHSTSLNNAKVLPTKRLIIPRTKRTYMTRRIDAPLNEYEAAYVKQLEGTQKDLFNVKALKDADTPIVCEGELDNISFYEAGADAVISLGTTSNIKRMFEYAKKRPDAVYILALDNDEAGRKAQERLAEMMEEAGLHVLNKEPAKIYGVNKDANETLIKERGRLVNVVEMLQTEAQAMKAQIDAEKEEELKQRTGEGMLDSFILKVTDKEARYYEGVSTGLRDVDRALEGGFLRQNIIMIGAPPAMGKTALAQWILENMAKDGHDVLYINLEMSRDQLLARSLSRLAWQYGKNDFSSLDILRGYQWTPEKEKAIMDAFLRYRNEIAPRFIYNPDGTTNHIDSILHVMEGEAMRITATGRPAPIVCIDYLQLVDSGNRDAIEGTKNVIKRLKDYAIKNNTIILAIMANNRASNKTGTVDMESGRDTSALEYSGDLMLGLSYTAIEDRREYTDPETKESMRYDLDLIRRLSREAYDNGEEPPRACKEVSLKVMKNRFGCPERRIKLLFDGRHSTFTPIEHRFTDNMF